MCTIPQPRNIIFINTSDSPGSVPLYKPLTGSQYRYTTPSHPLCKLITVTQITPHKSRTSHRENMQLYIIHSPEIYTKYTGSRHTFRLHDIYSYRNGCLHKSLTGSLYYYINHSPEVYIVIQTTHLKSISLYTSLTGSLYRYTK